MPSRDMPVECRYTVLFDGDCPVCQRAVTRLRAQDRDGILQFAPAQSSELEERFPWIRPEALNESMHLVGPGDKTWTGADAVEELVKVLPGWGWLSWIFRIPLARPIARSVYAWVARNRYAFFRR